MNIIIQYLSAIHTKGGDNMDHIFHIDRTVKGLNLVFHCSNVLEKMFFENANEDVLKEYIADKFIITG